MEISKLNEAAKNPINKLHLTKQIKQEERLRFHTQPSFDFSNRYAYEFLTWVRTLIPKDKHKLFKSALVDPIDTVRITDEAFETFRKLFSGKDPAFNIEFSSDTAKEDFEDQNKWLRDWWRTESFKAFKDNISAFLVVDLPVELNGNTKPEPYPYFVDIRNVIDYHIEDDEVQYLIFDIEENKRAAYCDEYYRVFNIEDNTDLTEGNLISENAHDLGYAPAFKWYSDTLDGHTPRSPLTNYLGFLDWLLFYVVSKRVADLSSPWEIIWQYGDPCDYDTTEDGQGEYCDKGFLRTSNGSYVYGDDNELTACPKCSKRLAGAGGTILVPIPEADEKPLGAPLGRINAEVDNLKYNGEECERLESVFLQGCTGYSLDLIRNQALNEDQVHSVFDSSENVLLNIQRNFELAESWLIETYCRLRYGASFQSVHISYGTSHYIFSYDILYKMYQEAKQSGADSITLDMLQNQCFETKYKTNPKELQRVMIENHIEPYRHLTNSECLLMFDKGLISREDLYMKLNLSTLKMRFKRENGSLLAFGENLEFDERIARITERLREYIEVPEKKEAESLEV